MAKVEVSGSLPSRMKAIVVHAPNDYRYEDVPVPAVGDEDVLIKVMASGICGSDIKCWHGSPYMWGGPDYAKYIREPVTAGHEFFGQVVALGAMAGEKHKVKLGDHVVPEQIVPCGKCRYCQTGLYHLCQVHDIYGFRKGSADGGMAEYARLSGNARIHVFPKSFDLNLAAFIEPLGCAIHGVERGDIQFDDVVAVAGLGPVGLGMLQAAMLKNPKGLIAIDLQDKRLAVAKKLGAAICLNPTKVNVKEEVAKLTDGYGVDVYINATGQPTGVLQGLGIIRKLGRYVEYSVFGENVTTDWSVIGDGKELNVLGGHLSPWGCYPSAIRFLGDGRIKAVDMITHRLPLAQWLDGFKLVEKGDESIKVMLIP